MTTKDFKIKRLKTSGYEIYLAFKDDESCVILIKNGKAEVYTSVSNAYKGIYGY